MNIRIFFFNRVTALLGAGKHETDVKDFVSHAVSKGRMRKYEVKENAERKYENKSIYQKFAI